MDKNKFAKIWNSLYSTLTTTQITKALRDSGASHAEWLEFCQIQKKR
jgi:hypothetical protein